MPASRTDRSCPPCASGRQDSPSRIIGAPVEFSFDDVDLDAISSEYTTVGVRTVRQLDAFPEMTWVAAGALTNLADMVDYWGGFRTSIELALDLPAAKRLPTFVRIRKGPFENTCNFSEFELRLMELPPEPEGTAQVDEVGSSYVKLSGHLLNRGNASSDCTVRFVARPAVGEPTVATVAEGVTTGDDFAATVKKLKPETAYDWQIVVSNAPPTR